MDALMVLVHWLHLLALALWVGGLAVLLVVLPGRRVRPEDVVLLESARQRTQAVLWWAVIALLVTLAAEIALRVQGLGGTTFMPALRTLLFGTRYGVASVLRWLLLVVALLAVDELGRTLAAVPARAPRAGRQALGIVAGRPRRPHVAVSRAAWLRLAALLAGGVLVCTAVAGPYGAAPLPAAADLLHLAATALWLGGAIVLAVGVAPFVLLVERERRPQALLTLLNRYSPAALLGGVVLALSGAWEAAQRLHGANVALFSTPFGRALGARALVLALIVALSAWSALVLRPRLRRLAMRVRRDRQAALRADGALSAVWRVLLIVAPLAMLALLLGAIADAAPTRIAVTVQRHGAVVAARHAGAAAAMPGTWQELGPSTIVHSLVVDPADRARMYEGTIAGVYRSTDGGRHWAPASTGLVGGGREVWSLSVIPDGSLVATTGAGLYRSTDGAGHWRTLGLESVAGGARSIYTLAAHLAGGIVLLAGGDGGVFRSADMGAHWTQVYDSGTAAVASLAWPSVRPSLVIAGINPGPASVAISRDGGATWRTAVQGLPAGPGMMTVAVAPGAQDAYAGTMGLGIYALPGLSGRWQGRNSGLPGLAIGDAHVGSFAFDPAGPRTLYAATDFGVYRSGDSGQHWSPFGRGLRGNATVVTTLTLVAGPQPTQHTLYAATAAGLYRLQL